MHLAALYNVRVVLFMKECTSLVGLQPREFLQLCEDIVSNILKEYVQILVSEDTQSSISTINQELDQ